MKRQLINYHWFTKGYDFLLMVGSMGTIKNKKINK